MLPKKSLAAVLERPLLSSTTASSLHFLAMYVRLLGLSAGNFRYPAKLATVCSNKAVVTVSRVLKLILNDVLCQKLVKVKIRLKQ